MAGLRFSHMLLIAALSSWVFALTINTFFPSILYSFAFEHVPLFVGTLTSIVEIPAHYLLSILPANRQEYFSIICFHLAIACAFIAGSVYGMERESEHCLAMFEAENAINTHEEGRYYDLEKGELPAYTDSPYADSPYTDEKNTRPVAAMGAGADLPAGDSMTGTYYPSDSAQQHDNAQARARDSFIASNRAYDVSFNGSSTTFTFAPRMPATAHLAPSIPAGHVQGSCSGMDPLSNGGPCKYVSVITDKLPETELFSVYIGDEDSKMGDDEDEMN